MEIAEIILTLGFILFTCLAFMIRDIYLFAMAGLFSIIFGVDIALMYVADSTANWALGIVGAGLIFFGLYMLVASVQFSLNSKGRKTNG